MDTTASDTGHGFLTSEELLAGGVYRLQSRNLNFGVYDGERGFIGIREKFSHRYLDTEYLRHTARALELVGTLTSGIVIAEDLGRKCQTCGGPVKCLESEVGFAGARWREWHVDADGKVIEGATHGIHSVFVPNDALFAALEGFETATDR